jgi:hypothetical protein
MLHRAFFLDALTLPQAGNKEMTAYEVGQRVQEYIRNACRSSSRWRWSTTPRSATRPSS